MSLFVRELFGQRALYTSNPAVECKTGDRLPEAGGGRNRAARQQPLQKNDQLCRAYQPALFFLLQNASRTAWLGGLFCMLRAALASYRVVSREVRQKILYSQPPLLQLCVFSVCVCWEKAGKNAPCRVRLASVIAA